MVRKLLTTGAALAASTAACFNPNIDFCAPCAAAAGCPDGAACVAGLCVFDDQRCVARRPDTAPERTDASSPAAASAACSSFEDGENPTECWDQCCVGSQRHVFPASIKEGLVLWLDGSHLSGLAPGDALDLWPDRSSGKHDAHASLAAPTAGTNSVRFDDPSQVLVVPHHARHDLGNGDFVLLLAFSLPQPRQFHCLLAKTVPRTSGFFVNLDKLGALILTLNGDCSVAEGCTRLRSSDPLAADRLQVVGIRRIHGARLELRLNSEVVAHTQLALDYSLASTAPLVLGSCGPAESSRILGSIFAALLVRATVSDAELAALEGYLAGALAVAP